MMDHQIILIWAGQENCSLIFLCLRQHIIKIANGTIRKKQQSAASMHVSNFDSPRLRIPFAGSARVRIKHGWCVMDQRGLAMRLQLTQTQDGRALPCARSHSIWCHSFHPPVFIFCLLRDIKIRLLRPFRLLLQICVECDVEVPQIGRAL